VIPNIPILGARVYRSGLSDSSYDPRNLITYVDDTTITPWTYDDLEVSFEYSAATIHERVHWLQHHGTSFGVFLDAIRISQEATTERWFDSMSKSELAKLLKDRQSRTRPPLPIDRNQQQPVFDNQPNAESSDLDTWRQIWFDHQWVHTALENSVVCDDMGSPPSQVFGEVASDVMLGYCGDFGFKTNLSEIISTDQQQSRTWFRPNDRIAFLRFAESRLTSKLLMEASATIAEIRYFRTGMWSGLIKERGAAKILNRRFKTLLEGEYGTPVRLIAKTTGIEDEAQLLATSAVLCFAALNPPVPPYVMAPPSTGGAWSWADIYPPLRFARLCKAARKVGIISECLDHELLRNYIGEVCDAAGVTSVVDATYPEFQPRLSTPSFDNPKAEYPDTLALTHQDYRFWVQAKLATLRRSDLPLFVSLGDCMSGELLKKYLFPLLHIDGESVPFAYSPLHSLSDGKLGFTCPVGFGNWLTRGVAMQNAMFDLVVGTGNFDLEGFPSQVKDGRMNEYLRFNLLRRFGIECL
jgi:hypothetical protein